MNETARRIYLDNAATSWPKPAAVYEAVDHYQRHVGVAAGRGSYQEAENVARTIQRARTNIAKLAGASSGNQIVFTSNCTDSLNLVLHGLLRADDHVITSVAEHNSVLRPLATLKSDRHVATTQVRTDSQGRIDLDELRSAMTAKTKLIALTHASNVTGTLQPIAEVGRLAQEHEVRFLVDAAQTLGHVPIDVTSWQVDFLAAPGHKGLLGPLGTGLLYIAPGLEAELSSMRQGGTGTQSERAEQPEQLPAKYESGNLNVPGLVGLDAGVSYVQEHGLDRKTAPQSLAKLLVEQLSSIRRVRWYGTADTGRGVGIVSFTVEGYDASEVASMLETAGRVQVRAGLHCAPEMHRALGTLAVGGTVRVSCGHFNTAAQIDRVVELVGTLASSAVP